MKYVSPKMAAGQKISCEYHWHVQNEHEEHF